MNININSPFKASPRISRTGFIAVLERVGSFDSEPLWGPYPRDARRNVAHVIYDEINAAGHDPAVFLAIAGKEHMFGTNLDSVLGRNHTRSWTNARSVRHPDIEAEIITDSYRRSQYVRYQNVRDSVRDGVYRVGDPTFDYQQAGATSIAEVIAIWAPSDDQNDPAGYSRTMVEWINEWAAEFPVDGGEMSTQIPGFAWRPASDTHYRRGRTQTIRGFAQHYTAGTNSLDWLTHTSHPPVSATFLIKHNPTLEDRGWQLVRIEDTAWTTASANPFTVSCEYEHSGFGPIPDIAYTVMAKTILDTADYVARNNLGYIPLNREGIKGHREWVGGGTICPDGISMDRLVAEVRRLQKQEAPVPKEIELNGFRIIGGFKGRWESLGPFALPTLGLPLTDEFTATVDGVERTVQLFERAALGWYPEDEPHGVAPDDPMHVRGLTLTEAIDVRKQARNAGLI